MLLKYLHSTVNLFGKLATVKPVLHVCKNKQNKNDDSILRIGLCSALYDPRVTVIIKLFLYVVY